MTTLQQRKNEIISHVAAKANLQPVLDSGLLFHHDIRDNFYYASYLFAASQGEGSVPALDRKLAQSKAEGILLRVLQLQDQDPASETYGHWPLNLGSNPEQAGKNTLPVELMGSLMVYFFEKYKPALSEALRQAFEQALRHIYESGFFRKPMEHYHHHEAKYTSAKLIFGVRYDDQALLADGYESLRATYERISTIGMSEYGGLPWFWHWVQAFTCAQKLVKVLEIQAELVKLLDALWQERAVFYLGGAWVGARSRSWPHDLPRDANVLHDYVQFGDFKLPEAMPRTEYAGFLSYEASDEVRAAALNRTTPQEIKRRVPKSAAHSAHNDDVLHSYIYLTERYAIGGIWERVKEFDNEQHRWDVTLPLAAVDGVNRAFFFHPGQGYAEGDLRHQSEYTEVLFDRNVVIASYLIPEGQTDRIVGCLPPGEWVEAAGGIYGRSGDVYLAVYIQQAYQREEQHDRSVITSQGLTNAVIVECVDATYALSSYAIQDARRFAAVMQGKQPVYESIDGGSRIAYTTLDQRSVELSTGSGKESQRRVNGEAVDLSTYIAV